MAALQILGAVIAGIAGFLWLVMLWAGQLNRPKRAPPGSFGLPVIGETLQFAIDGRSLTPHVYAEKRKAKYGPVYTTHHKGYPAVMSVDPEVNKFIMQNEGKYFVSNYPRSLRNLFGEGAIVRVYGELHKRIHNVVLSFINTSKLKEYVLADVEHMIQTPMTDWARRPVVYVEDECKTMAFNIITKYLLGLMPGEETTYLMAEYRKFIEGIISIPIKLPGTYYYRSMKAKEKCVKVMKRIMEEKRKQPQSEAKDIMSALMAESGGNGEKLSDTIICNNIMNLLGAGEETSPMAMMCAVKYITECPKALQQLREEHLAIRKSKRPGESLTWDDYTNRMTFTHYVINETLRLVNPASGVLRRAIKDVEFKGYFFPKDWLAFPYIRSVHLEESVYPDPFTFNPWRWEKKLPSMYFTPFGGGLRVCAGQELAKLEISVFLHYLVTQFTWTLHDDEQINFPAVTFKNQLPMTVKSLQH